eukprot:6455784-Prorocentrum_lima.AAC.1
MTSSLVGSEMCIRDRASSANPKTGSLMPQCKVKALTRQLSRCPGCERPVSYTHLTLPTICSV